MHGVLLMQESQIITKLKCKIIKKAGKAVMDNMSVSFLPLHQISETINLSREKVCFDSVS